MSVVIKGMKMPDNCSECQLEYDQMLCRIVGYWYEQSYLDIGFDPSKDKLPECPLVELPEHHGDLVDVNEIQWDDHYDSDGNLSKYKIAYSDEMPDAIVEAE